MIRTVLAAAAALLFLVAAPAAVAREDEGAWVKPMLQRMVQPTNAARFEALTGLLKQLDLPYTVHEFAGSPQSKGEAGRNVVVTIGQGPRDIVLTAHYDAEKLEDGSLVGGVVDNAASVVALMQAAVDLRDHPLKNRIVIVFFDQEELGLLGSAAWIKSVDRSRVAAVVNFDVVGYGDTVVFGGLKNDPDFLINDTTAVVCAALRVDCLRFPAYPPSDDRSFAAAGLPVISIGVQPAADAHQMWLLMNRGAQSGMAQGVVPRVFRLIHTPDDNMTAIEPAAVVLASRMAFHMATELDHEVAGS